MPVAWVELVGSVVGGFGVARILDGEKMAPLCREFGISREGLDDRSRRPYRPANQLPHQVEQLILRLKKEHPNWGSRKIRDKVLSEFSPPSG